MSKKLITIFFAISLLLFGFSLQRFILTYKFSTTEVVKNINYLSSDVFKGRLAGTLNNEAASVYVKSQFEKADIKPLFKTYYENFNVTYPEKIEGSPHLSVLDKNGTIIKNFEYNKDFKEDTLSFKQNHLSFSKVSSTAVGNDFLKIKSGNNICVLYAPADNKLSFRSSFDESSKLALIVVVKKDVLKTIKDYLEKDDSIDCFIPYKESNANIHNVVGYIKGRDQTLPPVVISAHFDHMGNDLSGNIYSGALDNASGTSFIIEMAKYINSLGTPDRNIIFAGFNAEEFGFKGSSTFAKDYGPKLKGSKVFNFDMIGGRSSIPLSIMGSKNDNKNTPLVKEISNICTSSDISYSYIFQNSSDHTPFRNLGIDAVTFCDDDTSRIHTTSDKAAFIDKTSIQKCYTVASKEILTSAFTKNPLVLYDKLILIFSGIGTGVCIIYIIRLKFTKKKLN